jgi:hypothetical protein
MSSPADEISLLALCPSQKVPTLFMISSITRGNVTSFFSSSLARSGLSLLGALFLGRLPGEERNSMCHPLTTAAERDVSFHLVIGTVARI